MSNGWFTSTFSGGSDNCVEVQHQPDGGTSVRHSKNPDGVRLSFSSDMWTRLLEAVQTTRFPANPGEWSVARPHRGGTVRARQSFDGSVELTHAAANPDEVLAFTADEWSAFAEGARAGEFAWRPPAPWQPTAGA